MRIIYNKKSLDSYFKDETLIPNRAILIDKFLNDAKEVDVDAISDGNDVFVCGILEHIEEAGIHSGDSACSLPPLTLSRKLIKYLEQFYDILISDDNINKIINNSSFKSLKNW